MKAVWLALAIPMLLRAQSIKQTSIYDVNGNVVRTAPLESTNGLRTQRVQSINGGTVPLEQTEERVVRSDSNGKTIERVVKKFDPDGQFVRSERVVIEERNLPDGSASIRTTSYQTDVNGHAHVVERSSAEIHRSASAGTSEVLIERPAVDGYLMPAERRVTSEKRSADGASATTTIYKPDTNGRFAEFAREAVERRVTGSGTDETTTRFETGATGTLSFASMSRRHAAKNPDGSEAVVVDVYGPTTPGLVNSNGPRIQEQQIIERRSTNGGTVETLSVRRPQPGDPSRLGPPAKVSETVCTGKCQ